MIKYRTMSVEMRDKMWASLKRMENLKKLHILQPPDAQIKKHCRQMLSNNWLSLVDLRIERLEIPASDWILFPALRKLNITIFDAAIWNERFPVMDDLTTRFVCNGIIRNKSLTRLTYLGAGTTPLISMSNESLVYLSCSGACLEQGQRVTFKKLEKLVIESMDKDVIDPFGCTFPSLKKLFNNQRIFWCTTARHSSGSDHRIRNEHRIR